MEPIDLTLPLSEQLPSFPGSPQPHFIQWSEISKDGYNLELLFFSSHSGTHLDAPFHFKNNRQKIHEIPLGRLMGDAILITINKKPNHSILKSEIIQFEKKYGQIPNGANVIFHTRWSQFLKNSTYFTKNPGLSIEAAKYLAKKNVNLVGIDSPSIDSGTNTSFPVHKIFAQNKILIVENLTNLEKISNVNFKLIVLPLKLKNATGSPVRAIAI